MNRSVPSVSIVEAERIRKAANEEYIKLRESLLSTLNKDDSNYGKKHQTSVIVNDVDRIKKDASRVFEELRKAVTSSDCSKEISKVAITEECGGNLVGDATAVNQPIIDQPVIHSGKEVENRASKKNACDGIVSYSTRLTNRDTRLAEVNHGIKSSPSKRVNSDTQADSGSARCSRKEVMIQLAEASTMFTSTTSAYNDNVDRSFASFSHNQAISSESVEHELETSVNYESVDKSVGRKEQSSNSNSRDTHSWENFASHLIQVQTNGKLEGLLDVHDVTIINSFSELNFQTQRVYVQFLMKEYAWYRQSSLSTTELNHELTSNIDILIEKQLVITDVPTEEIDVLIKLLSMQELKKVCKLFGLRDDGKQTILVKSLIEFIKKKEVNERAIYKKEILKVLGRVIKLSHAPRELFLRTQLLYALPLAKTMTNDGRIQLIMTMNEVSGNKICYPDYIVEPLQKVFPSREALLRFQQALYLEANIKWKRRMKDYDEAIHFYESAFIQFCEELRNEKASEWAASLPNCLLTFTRGTVLARSVYESIICLRAKKMHSSIVNTFEKLLSQDLYLKSLKGMWYDELAQIYQNIMKDIPKTVEFLTLALADSSLSYIDRMRISDRASRIINGRKRKRSLMYEEINSMLCIMEEVQELSIEARCFDAKIDKTKKFSYVIETEEGVGQILSTPEEVIMWKFKQTGYNDGIHSSAAIGSSIFGILFWDIIYQIIVPNAFLCPFQSLPLDLASGEFYINREAQIKKRVAQIKEVWNEEELYNHVNVIWSREVGKKSVVCWNIFQDVDQFKVILRCIGCHILAEICEKMAKEFHLVKKGFPSMILWNKTEKACKFIQVKEPNHGLTPTQKYWLLHLKTAGGDALMCTVNGVGCKQPKRRPDSTDDLIDLDKSMEIDCI